MTGSGSWSPSCSARRPVLQTSPSRSQRSSHASALPKLLRRRTVSSENKSSISAPSSSNYRNWRKTRTSNSTPWSSSSMLSSARTTSCGNGLTKLELLSVSLKMQRHRMPNFNARLSDSTSDSAPQRGTRALLATRATISKQASSKLKSWRMSSTSCRLSFNDRLSKGSLMCLSSSVNSKTKGQPATSRLKRHNAPCLL